MDRKGFTLIELMVVVVIIGILAVVLLPNVIGRSDKAKWDATNALIAKISNQVDMFKLDHGKYPAKLEDLLHQPSYVDPKNWPKTGYVKKAAELKDAWGMDLIYNIPGSGGMPYDLGSYGSDEKRGGEGAPDGDIWNHDKVK
ncbi:MAG: type II secretion system major pseudopilin GspG [Planctomycetota bacterium]|jgi:general secretion pathway protein G